MTAETIEKALMEEASDGDLSCASAFKVAAAWGVAPAAVGELADRLGLHICKCQLGLFGYPPQKKIVSPLDHVDPELSAAIREVLESERLPCRRAWEIADRLGVSRMKVSAACESLGIKIKPCQLGAF
jgi:hypothetical protein